VLLLYQLLNLYSLIVLVAVIASWVQLSPYNPIGRVVYGLTEPLLQPIRRVLPPMGGLDFSPLVLLLLVQLVKRLLFF
jgi:YggT family protein